MRRYFILKNSIDVIMIRIILIISQGKSPFHYAEKNIT